MATLIRLDSLKTPGADAGNAPEGALDALEGAIEAAEAAAKSAPPASPAAPPYDAEAMFAEFERVRVEHTKELPEITANNEGLAFPSARLVSDPATVTGVVEAKLDYGVVVRTGADISYVPAHFFADRAGVPPVGRTVEISLQDAGDGRVAATAITRIGAEPSVAPEPGEALALPPAAMEQPEAVRQLEQSFREFDAAALASDDPDVRAAAEGEFAKLSERAERLDRVFDGVDAAAQSALPAKLAAQLATNIGNLRAIAAAGAGQAQAAAVADQAALQDRSGGGHAGGGSALLANLMQPKIAGALAVGAGALALGAGPGAALLAGGAIALGGGSLALKGLAAARDSIGVARTARKRSSADVLATQVKSLSADIERNAQWLRAHGMDGVVDEMKASGHSMRDALPQMERGKPLERLGLQFKGLMQDPEFAARYGALTSGMDQLGVKAERYAAVAQAAGQDPDDVLDPAFSRVTKAVEGIPQEHEGQFKGLSDKMGEIADKIREVVNRLMGRPSPGRG